MHQHIFETGDLDLAALLIALVDAPLIRIDSTQSEDVRFIFDCEEAEEIATAYWHGATVVEPLTYAAAQRYLGRLSDTALNDEAAPTGLNFGPETGTDD